VRGLFLKQALLILAVAFLPAMGEAVYFRNRIPWASPVPASELVKADTAKSWGAQALWIDARSDDEFERGHYPGALPLNEDHWNSQLPAVLGAWSEEKKIVVYCSTHSCSASRQIAERLRNQANLKNVFVLDRGWEGLQGAKEEDHH
jgi:rhodanese-related sulfurtransferase